MNSIVTVLLLSPPCWAGVRVPEHPDHMPPVNAESVIAWLPHDTESVIVADRHAFPKALEDEEPGTLATALRLFTAACFGIAGRAVPNVPGPLANELKGGSILLGVKAARKFRWPSGVGAVQFEGCEILVLEDAKLVDKVWSAAKGVAKRTLALSGIEGLLFEEKLEGLVWSLYMARLSENVLVCGTSEAYVKEVMSLRSGTAKSSFLEVAKGRKEWKAVERKDTSVWGIRVYGAGTAENDPGSPLNQANMLAGPDPGAEGVAFSLAKDGSRVKGWYFTKSAKAADFARRYWIPEGTKVLGDLRVGESGGVEFVVALSKHNIDGYDLVLMAMSGHVTAL